MREPVHSIAEGGIVLLSDRNWLEAKRRVEVIAPLAELCSVSHSLADEAAKRLGLSRRTIYSLIKRYQSGDGLASDMVRADNSGGRGKGRLPSVKERIIADAMSQVYLSRQRRSMTTLMREIRKQSAYAKVKPPAPSSVVRRIEAIDPELLAKKRHGPDAARTLGPVTGGTPHVDRPLAVVQMDHTVVDIVIVDPLSRREIGRPYLTIAIDEFSRCIVGLVLSLDAPSSTSVGLCLAHAAAPKDRWLERRELSVDWPMHGIPKALYLDNASEFKSEALRKGCEQYGIALYYRPVAQPNYGGIVERVIGTLMKMVHELPGTTFSNPVDRGTYPSEKTAVLTLAELEKWMTLAICGIYHQSIHSTLHEPPASKWNAGILSWGVPRCTSNADQFLIDFLPIIRRSIGRHGFVIDHITYFSNSLKPWIAMRKKLGRFLIRRDPRDISRIWVLDTSQRAYIEIPYRSLSNPAVTLWEQRSAVAALHERGCLHVDEPSIFRVIEQMRQITSEAARRKRKARRNISRQPNATERKCFDLPSPTEPSSFAQKPVRPFDNIEEW